MKKLSLLLVFAMLLTSFLTACETKKNRRRNSNDDDDDESSAYVSSDSGLSFESDDNSQNNNQMSDNFETSSDLENSTESQPDNESSQPEDESSLPEDDISQPEDETPSTKALSELSVVSSSSNKVNNSIEDSYGNKYDGPYFDLCCYGDSNVRGEYITQSYTDFWAGGEYRYLSGTFFTRASQPDEFDIEFMVYADDELVYYSGDINRRTSAINFTIDINNCDVVRIIGRSYDYASSGTNAAIVLTDAFVLNEFYGELTESADINLDLVPITDLHLFYTDGYIYAGRKEDSYGNVYKGINIELCSYGNYSGTEYDVQSSAEFVANGNYNSFSGTFFTRTNQSPDYTIEFLIYADNELIYSSGEISRSTEAIDFTVDITGCTMLKIQSRSVDYTSSGTNPAIILVDAYVS